MKEDSSIIRFRQPDEIDDPLTALLRSGARRLLEQAIEAEVEAFLASRKGGFKFRSEHPPHLMT